VLQRTSEARPPPGHPPTAGDMIRTVKRVLMIRPCESRLVRECVRTHNRCFRRHLRPGGDFRSMRARGKVLSIRMPFGPSVPRTASAPTLLSSEAFPARPNPVNSCTQSPDTPRESPPSESPPPFPNSSRQCATQRNPLRIAKTKYQGPSVETSLINLPAPRDPTVSRQVKNRRPRSHGHAAKPGTKESPCVRPVILGREIHSPTC